MMPHCGITCQAFFSLPSKFFARIAKRQVNHSASVLEDIMDARHKGQNSWSRWFDRLGAYCEQRFGPDWQKGDRIFWEKFPFH
jgi:hypothetical protein